MKTKLLIHLHLYYTDLWQWFVPYLQKIDVDFDLFVSLTNGAVEDDFKEQIIKIFPDAQIRYFDNKGMDVAPFLWILNEAIKSKKNYTSILKLHGKKSLVHNPRLGETWRTALVSALLSSKENFNRYINYVENTDYKMIGAKPWVLQQNLSSYERGFFKDSEWFSLNNQYEFVGGTMFLSNFNMFKEWFVKNRIFETFYNNFENGYKPDHTLAHRFERIFGCLVYVSGNRILKV